VPIITQLRASGETMKAIGDALNDAGHCTQRRKPWTVACVRRLLVRENILSRYPVDPHRNNITPEIQRLGAEASGVLLRARARAAYASIVPKILAWYASGASLGQIARDLNAAGHRTQRWGPWSGQTVRHLIEREGFSLRPKLDCNLTPNAIREGVIAAMKANRERSRAYHDRMDPLVKRLRETGMTLKQIAAELNRRGRRTQRGCRWSVNLVWILLDGASSS
jgi:hypothetical protein